MHRTHPLTLRIPPLAVCALAGLVGLICARTFDALTVALPFRAWLAGVCGVLSIVYSVLAVASFRRARTTVNPMRPSAATALVVSGVYQFTRNPMYVGFLFLLLAELVWLANPVAWLAAPLFVLYLNRFQIASEEQALSERFGPSYAAYTARVRRWI